MNEIWSPQWLQGWICSIASYPHAMVEMDKLLREKGKFTSEMPVIRQIQALLKMVVHALLVVAGSAERI
jgi:hypothetical protein